MLLAWTQRLLCALNEDELPVFRQSLIDLLLRRKLLDPAFMERAMGIEPTSKAWEAYDITQKHAGLAAFLQF